MLSRAQRRYRDKQKKSGADSIEEKKKANPWLYGGSVVILILIVVTFVGTPAVRGSRTSGGIVFGSYGGKEITYIPGNYFARQRELIGEQAQASGESVDSASTYYQIWRQAFLETVRHTAIMLNAAKGGLYISDDAVDSTLISYGPYQENGKFSESRYNRASASEKYATRQLFRDELTQDQYLTDTINGVLSSSAESAKLANMANPERSFTYVTFAYADYPDEKVVEYGTANAGEFTRIKVSRILVKSGEREAASIRSRLEADPLRFEEIAKASSKDSYASAGGSMGWQYRHDLALDFDKPEPVDAVLALRQGEISQPLGGKFGWMIFRCDEPAVTADLGLAEDRQTVRAYLEIYEAGMVQDFYLERAKAFVSRARVEGFASVAAAEGLAVGATTFFPMNYMNVFFLKPVGPEETASSTAGSAAFTDALYSEEFFTQAFGVRDGEVAEPVVLGESVVVLALRAEREPPQTDMDIMGDYYKYIAQQALANDLEAQLLDSASLVDKFDETYLTYVAPTGS